MKQKSNSNEVSGFLLSAVISVLLCHACNIFFLPVGNLEASSREFPDCSFVRTRGWFTVTVGARLCKSSSSGVTPEWGWGWGFFRNA